MVVRGVARAGGISCFHYHVKKIDSLPLDSRNPVRLVHGCESDAKDIAG